MPFKVFRADVLSRVAIFGSPNYKQTIDAFKENFLINYKGIFSEGIAKLIQSGNNYQNPISDFHEECPIFFVKKNIKF
ncbi:hypothetical protein QUF72_22465 [Desulfobacterales bacterium HSG2]|nr:hypothetical protein [Desulfobacterales bacterium HSG2]